MRGWCSSMPLAIFVLKQHRNVNIVHWLELFSPLPSVFALMTVRTLVNNKLDSDNTQMVSTKRFSISTMQRFKTISKCPDFKKPFSISWWYIFQNLFTNYGASPKFPKCKLCLLDAYLRLKNELELYISYYLSVLSFLSHNQHHAVRVF